MTVDELHTTVTVAGIHARVKGDEVQIETCTFCANPKWNLELSASKGVYHCWACRSSGRVGELLLQLTGRHFDLPVQDVTKRQRVPEQMLAPLDFVTLPVAESTVATRFLMRRGIDVALAQQYGIRVCDDASSQLHGRMVIPALDYWTGALLGWVGRSLTGARPKYLSTLPEVGITGWRRPGRSTPVVIVEGHLDGIAAHRAGASAAVLAGQAKRAHVESWVARLHPATPVLVMLDGDARAAAERLYWQLVGVRGGDDAVRLVTLAEGQDPGGLLPGEMQDLLTRGMA